MSRVIGIVGESGSGKTTSFRNLDENKTFIISVTAKPLSFRNWKKKYKMLTKDENGEYSGNYYVTCDHNQLIKILKLIDMKMPHIKNIIIDDLQYISAFEFVDRSNEKGFDKFNDLAKHLLDILRTPFTMRNDLTVVFTMHSENVGDSVFPVYKIKTLGKLLSEKVTIEGLFTTLLFTKVDFDESTQKSKYVFVTNNDGVRCAKTPIDMFEDLYIDNDLQMVIDTIEDFE